MVMIASFSVALALLYTKCASAKCEYSKKWGKNDEIGAANLITPESVLTASQLVKTGKTYPLGIVIEPGMPAFPPRYITLQIVQPNHQFSARPFKNLVYNDDAIQGWLGIGSHMDGLSHAGDGNGTFYNCNEGKDFAVIAGVTKMGIQNIPPLVARGVLIDMAKYFGFETLEAGFKFGVANITAAADAQGVDIRKGDVVLFHTGWTDAYLKSDPKKWLSGEPGTTEEAATWLASKEVLAVGADTGGLDVMPEDVEGRPYQGHVILLKENGIYILEVMNTGPLAKDGVTEFMFVLGQARIKGTVQMIVNPIAIV